MRIAKVALVAILFLLIPHQAPFAGPSDTAGANDGGDPATRVETATEAVAALPEPARRDAALWDEGFVLSLASSTVTEATWAASADHLETDGYSWSVDIP